MNIRRWLITLLACVLLFAGLAGYKVMKIRAAIAFAKSMPEPAAAVDVMTVTPDTARDQLTTIGELLAPSAVEVRNELPGRIVEVNLPSGGKVRKGEVLLRLDVSEETARLAAARANAALAQLTLRRMQTLLARKMVSQDRLDQARAEADVATARAAELQAIIDKKTLRAPFDAVTGLHHLEVGQYLNANSSLVWIVGIRDDAWVDFALPLAQGSVALGDTVTITRTNGDDAAREATVIAVDPAVSPQSRSRRYRARLPADPALAPNSVVNVTVSAGERQEIQVPTTAVLRDELGPYVFVLENDDKGRLRARRQSIGLGGERGTAVSVLSGLTAGQTIATDGAFKLRSGMAANVGGVPPAAPATTGAGK